MQCSRLSLYVATVHRYTTFTVKWPSAPPPTPSIDNSNLTATASFTVQVTNTGPRDGDEVVQAYYVPGVSSDPLLRQIVAFQRVHVPAGSAEEVTLTVTPMDFIQVDTAGDRLIVDSECVEHSIGSVQTFGFFENLVETNPRKIVIS